MDRRAENLLLLFLGLVVVIIIIGSNISGKSVRRLGVVEEGVRGSGFELGLGGDDLEDEPPFGYDCSDGIDNDGDGYCDYVDPNYDSVCSGGSMPGDPACRSPQDDEVCGNYRIMNIIDGDAYYGESNFDPDWVWDLRNLDEVSPTYIWGPDNLDGPIIGIQNDFTQNDDTDNPPGSPPDSPKSWDLPERISYHDGLPYGQIVFVGWEGVNYIDVLGSIDYDALGVYGGLRETVPEEYQGYLGWKGLIEITTYSDDAFRLLCQDESVHGDYFFDYWNYRGTYVGCKFFWLSNIFEDNSVSIWVYNGGYYYDTVPLGESRIINGIEVTNVNTNYNAYTSQVHVDYDSDNEIIPLSVSRIWLNVFDSEIGIFIEDPNSPTPSKRFFKAFDSITDIASVEFGSTDEENFVISGFMVGDSLLRLDVTQRGDNSNELLGEVIMIRWKIENGEFVSLGELEQTPEAIELKWADEETSIDINLGLKDEDHRTRYGTIIKNPSQNGANDQVVLHVPGDQVKAEIHVLTCKWLDEYTKECGGETEWIPLGKALVGDYGFDWRFDNNDLSYFQDTKINYNSQLIDVHDELLLGLDSPTVETSLTSPDDDYESDVFMEVVSGRIKYYYAFDNAVDITQVSYENPLKMVFLGREWQAVEYLSPTSLKVRTCLDRELSTIPAGLPPG